MNYPGFESDTSGEEEITPPPSPPKPKPHFSFRALFEPSRKTHSRQQKEDIKGLTPVQAAEQSPSARPRSVLKKTVRIHVDGEEHPDKPTKLDLLASPAEEQNQQQEGGDMQSDALATSRKPDEVAGEVLGLLRQLLAESSTARQPSPPGSARIEALTDGQGDTMDSPANALGLSEHDIRDARTKKPSKLLKLAQITGFYPSGPLEASVPHTHRYDPHMSRGHTRQSQAYSDMHARGARPAKASHGIHDDHTTHTQERGDHHALNEEYYRTFGDSPADPHSFVGANDQHRRPSRPLHPQTAPLHYGEQSTRAYHATRYPPTPDAPHAASHYPSPAPPYPTSAPPWITASPHTAHHHLPRGHEDYPKHEHGGHKDVHHSPRGHEASGQGHNDPHEAFHPGHHMSPRSPICPHCNFSAYHPPQPALCYPLPGHWCTCYSNTSPFRCPHQASPIFPVQCQCDQCLSAFIPLNDTVSRDPGSKEHSPHRREDRSPQFQSTDRLPLSPHKESRRRPSNIESSPQKEDDPSHVIRPQSRGRETAHKDSESSDPSGLQSPRILVRDDKGFKEVEAYPEAKEKASRSTIEQVPKDKPPQYSKDDTKRSTRARLEDHNKAVHRPVKVDLGDKKLSAEKLRKIEEMKRAREKEKIRQKAAEGSLSPKEVSEAVDKAARSREVDDEVEMKMQKVLKQREKIKEAMQARKLGEVEGEKELERLTKTMDQLKREMGKSKPVDPSKIKPEHIPQPSRKDGKSGKKEDSSEAVEQLEKIEKRIEQIKVAIKDGASPQLEWKQELDKLIAERDQLKSGLLTEADRASSNPTEPRTLSDEASAEDNTEGIRKQIDRIKRKVMEGKMDKEAGSKAISQLKKKLEQLAAPESKPGQLSNKPVEGRLEALAERIERIQQKVMNGEIDQDTGRQELAKLEKTRMELRKSVGTSSRSANSAEGNLGAGVENPFLKDASTTEEINMIKRQVEKMRGKIQDGTIEEGEGKARLAELMKRRDNLSRLSDDKLPKEDKLKSRSTKSTDSPSEPRTRQQDDDRDLSMRTNKNKGDMSAVSGHAGPPASVANSAHKAEGTSEITEKIQQLARRMDKIRKGVMDGSIPKDEGKKEMFKLAKMREQLELRVETEDPHNRLTSRIHKATEREHSQDKSRELNERSPLENREPKHRGVMEEEVVSTQKTSNQAPGSDLREDESQAEGKTTKIERPKSSRPREEVERQIERIKHKVTKGEIPEDDGKKEIAKLSKMLDQMAKRISDDATIATKQSKRELTNPEASEEKVRGAVETTRSEGKRTTDDKDKIQRQIERLKQKVIKGDIPKEEGKTEIAKLSRLLNQMAGESKGDVAVKEKESKRELKNNESMNERARTEVKTAKLETEQVPVDEDKIKRQIERIKQKVMKGDVPNEEGKKEIAKLSKMLESMASSLETEKTKEAVSDDRTLDKHAISPSKSTEPKTSKEEIQEELDRNKKEMSRVKAKMAEGGVEPKDAEKMLQKLSKKRDELKQVMASLEALPSTREAGKPATGEAVRDSRDKEKGKEVVKDSLDQELDPEILKEILAETTPLPTALSQRIDRSKAGGYQGDQAKTEGRSRTSVAQRELKRQSTESVLVPGRYPRSPRPPSEPTGHEVRSCQPRDGRLTEGSDLVRDASALADEGEPTWSSCLVSLATCIDLANGLLAELMASSRGKRMSQGNSKLMEILPRLLTSFLMQRDLVSSMTAIFGDEHSKSMADFSMHLNLVRTYLAAQHRKRLEQADIGDAAKLKGLEKEMTSAFELGSINAIFDHLINLSDYLTPQMLNALKRLLTDWQENGLTISNVIKAVITVQRELAAVAKAKAVRENENKAQEPAKGVMSVLDQLLNVLGDEGKENNEVMPKPPERAANTPVEPTYRAQRIPRSTPRSTPRSPLEHLQGASDQSEIQNSPKPEKTGPTHLALSRTPEPSSPRSPATTKKKREVAPLPPHSEVELRSPNPDPNLRDLLSYHSHPANREARHLEHRQAHLHLPPTTQAFLDDASPTRIQRSTTPPHSHHNLSARDEGRLHHIPESTIVRPPGPSFGAEGSEHEVRRPSVWSSDSHYSNESESEGTIESDDEAEELLARADSGPLPVHHHTDQSDVETEKESPSEDQVRRAREVMLAPERDYIPPTVTVVHKVEP